MKFWVYFDGDIEGPYTVEALIKRGGVGPTTLVCPESSAGESEQDWQLADFYPELAAAFGTHAANGEASPQPVSPEQELAASHPRPCPPPDSHEPADEQELSEDLIALQHRMEQLGLSFSAEDDTDALEEERRRLVEQSHLRRVIRRRTSEIIGTIETGLDDAGKKIDRQMRRLENIKYSAEHSQPDSVSGGIRALGPLFPSWRQNLDSNELLQIAASDTALFSTLQSGKTVIVPDKPVWPQRKVPRGAPGVFSAPAEAKPVPQPAPQAAPQPQPRPVPHTFKPKPVVPAQPAPEPESVTHQEVSDLVAERGPISAAYTEPIPVDHTVAEAPVAESAAAPVLPEMPALKPKAEEPASSEPQQASAESVPAEQPVVALEQPVAQDEPAPAQAEPEAAAPEAQAEPALVSEPTPIAIPPVEKPASTPIRQAMSDFDFPFSPKYLGKGAAGADAVVPESSSSGSASQPNVPSVASEPAAQFPNPLASIIGTQESTPQSPSKLTNSTKEPPSFNLSDTVPLMNQPGSSTLSASALDPRLAENSKSTLAPASMLNLSKTTMYGSAPEEGQTMAPQQAQAAPEPSEKPARSARTLILLVSAAAMAVVGAVVFFFLRQDASVKGSVSQETASETATGTSSEQATSSGTTVQAVVPAPAAQEAPAAPVRTASGSVQAVDIAKNHDLGMGKGKLSAWLQSSYGAAGQEDWSATQLLGDIYVVQYRLLRARQEPIAYQFEVNVKDGKLTKGINNSAIELLGGGADLPSARAKAKPAASRKPVDKRRNSKRR